MFVGHEKHQTECDLRDVPMAKSVACLLFYQLQCECGADSNFNPLPKISVGFRLTAGRNSKGHYVCSGVC